MNVREIVERTILGGVAISAGIHAVSFVEATLGIGPSLPVYLLSGTAVLIGVVITYVLGRRSGRQEILHATAMPNREAAIALHAYWATLRDAGLDDRARERSQRLEERVTKIEETTPDSRSAEGMEEIQELLSEETEGTVPTPNGMIGYPVEGEE